MCDHPNEQWVRSHVGELGLDCREGWLFLRDGVFELGHAQWVSPTIADEGFLGGMMRWRRDWPLGITHFGWSLLRYVPQQVFLDTSELTIMGMDPVKLIEPVEEGRRAIHRVLQLLGLVQHYSLGEYLREYRGAWKWI